MKLKTLVLTGLATLLLMVPTSVFADTETEDERDRREFRLDQVAEYTPEQVVEWTRLFESKDILKAEREVLKAELEDLIENVWKPMIEEEKAEARALVEAYAGELKIQVENEEMTKEEATALLQTFKDDLRVDFEIAKLERQAEKEAREEERVYYDVLRAERKSLNESIKLAIENEETALIAGYLNDILSINQELEAHAIDVNNLIQEKINELK